MAAEELASTVLHERDAEIREPALEGRERVPRVRQDRNVAVARRSVRLCLAVVDDERSRPVDCITNPVGDHHTFALPGLVHGLALFLAVFALDLGLFDEPRIDAWVRSARLV